MRPDFHSRNAYEDAPLWAEMSAPRNLLRRTMPALLILHLPEDECWVVANRVESDAIANPESYLGGLLRQHCALMSLPYVSEN